MDKAFPKLLVRGDAARDYQILDAGFLHGFGGFGGKHLNHGVHKAAREIRA